MRCVNSLAWRSCKPCLITPRQMGWWRGLIKPLCRWLGSWEKIKKPTGQVTWLRIVHAYNATWSTVMGYSPHYLMFGQRPRLPVDFYFPTLRSTEVPKMWCLHQACGQICSHCLRPIEGHPSRGPGPIYGRGSETKMVLWLVKIGAIGLKPGNLVLVKADAFQGKKKIKDRWEDKPHEVVHQIMADVSSYEVKDQHGH